MQYPHPRSILTAPSDIVRGREQTSVPCRCKTQHTTKEQRRDHSSDQVEFNPTGVPRGLMGRDAS